MTGTSPAVQWLRLLLPAGSIPGWGAKFPQLHGQNTKPFKRGKKKRKQYCSKFNNDLKNGPYKKNLLKK